jgi:hypothetical protein
MSLKSCRVTTARFLEVLALGSLRDLPDLATLTSCALSQDADDDVEAAFDDALGLIDEDGAEVVDSAFDEPEVEV